jgi:hypothetical protein
MQFAKLKFKRLNVKIETTGWEDLPTAEVHAFLGRRLVGANFLGV